MTGTAAALLPVVVSHAVAAAVVGTALRIFLTPVERIETVPAQPVRYVIYALAILSIAIAAGSVLGAFVRGRGWLPLIYLWSVPFGIVLAPAIDPGAAHFLYLGVTSHFGGPLAVGASLLWIGGVLLGAASSLVSSARSTSSGDHA